jgi:CTD kinase subunit alpha
MFHYDPDKRPSAADVLVHPYFTAEEPEPKRAIEYVPFLSQPIPSPSR